MAGYRRGTKEEMKRHGRFEWNEQIEKINWKAIEHVMADRLMNEVFCKEHYHGELSKFNIMRIGRIFRSIRDENREISEEALMQHYVVVFDNLNRLMKEAYKIDKKYWG